MTAVVVVPLWRVVLVFVLALALVVGLTGQVLIPGGNIPSNGVILSTTASCPSGYTEVTQARGRAIVGLPSGGTALGTQGTALGDTAAPTFTGTAMAAHQHELPLRAGGTSRWAALFFGSGSAVTMSHGVTTAGDATSIAVDLTQSVSAGTPAGTLNVPTVQLMLCRRS